jgi:hypothetical protein
VVFDSPELTQIQIPLPNLPSNFPIFKSMRIYDGFPASKFILKGAGQSEKTWTKQGLLDNILKLIFKIVVVDSN